MAALRGDRVLIERRRLDLKQETLAAQVGVDRSYISQIERDADVNVGVKVVFALAESLGVSPAYLLGLSDNPLQGIEDDEETPLASMPPWAAGIGKELLDIFQNLPANDQAMLLTIAKRLRAADTPRVIGGNE
jgi:transcriptional regulator with XRE-family HTH domain